MQSGPIRMLKAACIMTICTGLVSAAASHPSCEALWALLFDILKWPVDGMEGKFSSEARVLNAVCGGMLAGWGAMMYWLANGPISRGDQSAKRAFTISVLIWFTIDSAGSLAAGWPGNVALNCVFLIALLGPLAALHRSTAAKDH